MGSTSRQPSVLDRINGLVDFIFPPAGNLSRAIRNYDDAKAEQERAEHGAAPDHPRFRRIR